MRKSALSSLGSLLLFGVSAAAQTAGAVPEEWLTVAERSRFEATSTYEETVEFVRRVEQAMPGRAKVTGFGRSGEGREMVAVVVSKEGAFTPTAARALGKPVVMIQSGIHAGEIDGKDASLMILRDLALGRRAELLEAATLLLVPIYNVDGHERVSPHNRPNQDGPRAGMGFRTTASGLDLNRDHLKIASAEARALVALVNDWRPHLHVDNHVTDGLDFAWVMTLSWAEAPQAPAAVDAWLRAHLPAVKTAMERAGHPTGPYVDLVDDLDPAKGASSWIGPPRFSTAYFALRNRPSVLVECHSYKPYGERVLANREFLLALLAEVGRDPAGLVRAVAEAEARTVALGRPEAPPSEIAVRLRESQEPDRLQVPIYEWEVAPSVVTGAPLLRYRTGRVRPIDIPWHHRAEVEKALPRPRGYLVLPGWPAIEERLRGHGLRVERLVAPAELEVEAARLSAPDFADSSYQGLTRVESVAVERTAERRRFPAGTLWVPADQPDFEVAVQLLEPEAPDSLLSWGLLSNVFEGKEYIEPRVLDAWAEEQLRDPQVAAAWQASLADEAFTKDPRARFAWWYRQHPAWDATRGLHPVFRVLAPPRLATAPW